ncbi:MAG: exosortase/archaeosortase family protein [Candidatus Diapherotrites archaeon]
MSGQEKKERKSTGGFSRKEALQAGKFILGIAVFFAAITFFLSLFPIEWFEFFFAQASAWALGFFGIPTAVNAAREPVLMMVQGIPLPIAISYLCTGLLEATVLVSAIAASFGIETRKRLKGIAGAVAVSIAFNFLRIVASILAIAFLGLEAGDLAHNILFRFTLFIVIAGYYWVWIKKSEK